MAETAIPRDEKNWLLQATALPDCHAPEGPSTQIQRYQAPKTSMGIVVDGTSYLCIWELDPPGATQVPYSDHVDTAAANFFTAVAMATMVSSNLNTSVSLENQNLQAMQTYQLKFIGIAQAAGRPWTFQHCASVLHQLAECVSLVELSVCLHFWMD